MGPEPSKILWRNYWLWEKICGSLKTLNIFRDECTTNKNGVETYYRLFLIFSQTYREFCWFGKAVNRSDSEASFRENPLGFSLKTGFPGAEATIAPRHNQSVVCGRLHEAVQFVRRHQCFFDVCHINPVESRRY